VTSGVQERRPGFAGWTLWALAPVAQIMQVPAAATNSARLNFNRFIVCS